MLLAHPASAAALAVLACCLMATDLWFRETLRYTLLGCSIVVQMAAVLFSDRLYPVQWIVNTVTIAVATISYYAVEQPFMPLRRHLHPSRSPVVSRGGIACMPVRVGTL